MSVGQTSSLSQSQLLRTGIWYGDEVFNLAFPNNWEVKILWPSCPPALTESEIAEALEHPIGGPPLRDMCRGAKRPLIIIDDVNRPTPVASVLPPVIRHFRDAGFSVNRMTLLVATGMHAAPHMSSIVAKIGREIASEVRVVVHDAHRDASYVGNTSFGTPVRVNKEVTASDFVIGIGGVYPNYTAGYGGGSKLALGVLEHRSILSLHCSHPSFGTGSFPHSNSFREDLNEIAQMIGIRSMISTHVNADGKAIRIRCGDYLSYYPDEVTFARRTFTASLPEDADVVISNAYPSDVSLTFALMKGAAPLYRCKPESSRVLLASCSEGLGGHGLFPLVNIPKLHRLKTRLRFAAVRPLPFTKKLCSAVGSRVGNQRRRTAQARVWKNPVWLYSNSTTLGSRPPNVPGVKITNSWSEIVQAIRFEQDKAQRLKVLVYPCAPLASFAGEER